MGFGRATRSRPLTRKEKLESSTDDGNSWGRGLGRWSPRCICMSLFLLILLPQLCYLVILEGQKVVSRKTLFGDNLWPTPWHWHLNPLGPKSHSTMRSIEVFKCSMPSWSHPLPLSRRPLSSSSSKEELCPAYFDWIQRDLAPWKLTGITRENIQKAKDHAAFRAVIVNGKLYVESFFSCVQTRALFTVWGMLLLLEKYKGQVPDVEIMFDCMDRPRIKMSENYIGSPPPLFRYCSNSDHYDIPWPDWSFWGWSETNLEPWDQQRDKIIQGSQEKDWSLKAARAYWRGNPDVGSPLRMELMKCNYNEATTEIQSQDWDNEAASGMPNSKLEKQCNHRYKIYAEGFAWSVSFKYILACGSPTLAISPGYYDFFMRGLVPSVHYIPVRPTQICASRLCKAIDKKVLSLEKNLTLAMQIGKAGQDFVRKEVGMQKVYDYMFHLLQRYASLQRFKPSVPKSAATEVTQEFILCLAQPHERLLLEQSRRHIPFSRAPCQMPASRRAKKVQNYEWEAEEQANKGWSQKNCSTMSYLR